MHLPAGFWKDSLGDIEVIAHEGVLHAFYLSIPSHDRVGHLTSRDGLSWEERPAALYTGDPGDFDDDQIWTMGVFEHAGRFFMLYTGLAMAEQGKLQRVGLATSDDLYGWEKYDGNPVLCADSNWYEAEVDESHRVDWRDPWVFVENGVLHGLLSARSNQGPPNRRGCAGYVVSTDGFRWEVKPPLCVPGGCYDFETPAVAKLQGRYYLTGICGKDEDVPTPSIVRVADRIDGPYRRVGHDELLPSDNQVFKPCTWCGRTLYFHHLRGKADWDGGGGQRVTCLAPPKEADVAPDGSLVLRPFRGWDLLPDLAETRRPMLSAADLKAAGVPVAGRWDLMDGSLRNVASDGFAAFLLLEKQESFVLDLEVEAQGPGEFGVLFRSSDDTDDATFVSLSALLRRIQLFTLRPRYKTPSANIAYRWRGRRIVQEWSCPIDLNKRLQIRLVVRGPYCEVSLDDRVVISALTMTRPAGHLGLFAEDANLAVRGMCWRAI